jgi:hypothetical protein
VQGFCRFLCEENKRRKMLERMLDKVFPSLFDHRRTEKEILSSGRKISALKKQRLLVAYMLRESKMKDLANAIRFAPRKYMPILCRDVIDIAVRNRYVAVGEERIFWDLVASHSTILLGMVE